MIVDAQYARSLFHVLPLRSSPSPFFLSRLSSEVYLPRLPVQHVIIEPVAALCRLLQLAISCSLTLPLPPLPPSRRVSHSTRRRSTKDRSIFVTRSSRHTRRARRLDRADYLKAGAHAPPAFASCGQAKEHGKVIKSATRCVIVEELISEIAQVYASRMKVDLDREDR